MTTDLTEPFRRRRLVEINTELGGREVLEAKYGQVWDTREMSEDFQPLGFLAPYLAVKRKADGVKGSLEFQHNPRFYFNFEPYTET